MKTQAIPMSGGTPLPREAQDNDAIDLGGLVRSLWRGKWILGFFVTVMVAIGGYYAYFVAVPKYAATTTLALQVRSQQVVDLQSVISGVSTDYTEMNTELVVMESRPLLEKVVQELKLTEDPEFNSALVQPSPYSFEGLKARLRERVTGRPGLPPADPNSQAALNRAVGALNSAVSVRIQPGTYIFEIRAVTERPEMSAAIANALARAYIADQIDVKFQATDNAVSWLSARVTELEIELNEKQDAIKQMRAEMDLTSQEGVEALNQRIRDLRDRLERSRADAAMMETRLEVRRAARATEDPAQIAEAFSDAILTRLLAQTGGSLSGEARQSFLTRSDTLLAQFENELQRTRQQVEVLESSLRSAEAEINSEFEKLVALQQAERDVEASRTLYETFSLRLKETAVQRGLQQADSRLLSEATSGYYVAPRKSRILMMSAIVGFMLGMALILARQYLHSGFRTSQDLERATGVPVIGQIPKLKFRRRKGLVDFLVNNPTSAGVEAYRNLRTSVLMTSLDRPPQIILSTSALPGEGKTTNAVALAHNFAGLGRRVLLMEGDIRRQTLFEYFDAKRGCPGLLTALEGGQPLEEILLHDERMGIDVLFGEKSPVNAADIFASETFRTFLEGLRERYDQIIIDTPPVLIVPDARVLGQYADGLLFSVAWNKTTSGQVTDAIRQLQSVNIGISGLILGQIDVAGMRRYGYGDRYGAYYSKYGKSYYDT